jgi:hypothetical protein
LRLRHANENIQSYINKKDVTASRRSRKRRSTEKMSITEVNYIFLVIYIYNNCRIYIMFLLRVIHYAFYIMFKFDISLFFFVLKYIY